MLTTTKPVTSVLGTVRPTVCRVCLTKAADHQNHYGQPLPCWKVFKPYNPY